MLLAPVVKVHDAVAPVGFDHRRDQRDDVLANVADVGALVHREAIGQFHQRGRRAGFGRVNRAGDVVHGRRALRDRIRHRIVHLHRARIGELRQVRLVLLEPRHQLLGGDRDRDHLASFLGRPDGVDLDARRRFLEQPHVVVHFFRVRQLPFRPGDVAQDGHRRRHGLRRRHVIHERRQEERLGRVLLDLLRVLLVDRLLRIAARLGRREVLARCPASLLLPRRAGVAKREGGETIERCRQEDGEAHEYRAFHWG